MKLSIIIPAYNEEKSLPETLDRIQKAVSNITVPAEVIVVDNDSQDDTGTIAKSLGAKVVLEKHHNISSVRNTGAGNSDGDILIFIDADTLVPDTVFQKITAAAQDERCFGGAVAVEWEYRKRKWMKWYVLGWKFWALLFNMRQGAAQFCRRHVFVSIGGYDETIFVGEDIEFYWRLSKFARKHSGYLNFIERPYVTTSARRFDEMNLWKMFLVTNPILVRLAWHRKSIWHDWYDKAVR